MSFRLDGSLRYWMCQFQWTIGIIVGITFVDCGALYVCTMRIFCYMGPSNPFANKIGKFSRFFHAGWFFLSHPPIVPFNHQWSNLQTNAERGTAKKSRSRRFIDCNQYLSLFFAQDLHIPAEALCSIWSISKILTEIDTEIETMKIEQPTHNEHFFFFSI